MDRYCYGLRRQVGTPFEAIRYRFHKCTIN